MHSKLSIRLGVLFIALMMSFTAAFSEEQNQQKYEASYRLSEHYNSFLDESGWLCALWGRPFRNHVYLGMWTEHFKPGDDQESVNNLLGLTYNGYFVGTFKNTHKDQVVALGWHRAWYKNRWGVFDIEAGYRLGLMYGYTQFLPILAPLPQAVSDIDYKGFGIELSWAGVIVSGGFYYRF